MITIFDTTLPCLKHAFLNRNKTTLKSKCLSDIQCLLENYIDKSHFCTGNEYNQIIADVNASLADNEFNNKFNHRLFIFAVHDGGVDDMMRFGYRMDEHDSNPDFINAYYKNIFLLEIENATTKPVFTLKEIKLNNVDVNMPFSDMAFGIFDWTSDTALPHVIETKLVETELDTFEAKITAPNGEDIVITCAISDDNLPYYVVEHKNKNKEGLTHYRKSFETPYIMWKSTENHLNTIAKFKEWTGNTDDDSV